MKLNDVRRFSAYVSTFYHSENITIESSCLQVDSDGHTTQFWKERLVRILII